MRERQARGDHRIRDVALEGDKLILTLQLTQDEPVQVLVMHALDFAEMFRALDATDSATL